MLNRFKRILAKPKSQIESLRETGCRIGENVDSVNSKINACHSSPVTIGDNVAVTNSTVLAHDASTKNCWATVRQAGLQ